MSKCHWVVEQPSGDHVLMKDGEECGRIPEGENTRMDEGMPGASFTTLKELREVLEKECGCKDIGDDSEVLK
ncbi:MULTISPECIES: hypothetical protein [Halomonas]|uniref:hypothetical protein n=1 Tax=Halomonas TaxID=2745 RepID=UPI000ED7CF5F|nr:MULTISPECIES: hypothetical protein [Halomonas]HCR98537.1 hypothetical protein [Halomonas sp.]